MVGGALADENVARRAEDTRPEVGRDLRRAVEVSNHPVRSVGGSAVGELPTSVSCSGLCSWLRSRPNSHLIARGELVSVLVVLPGDYGKVNM
jgi:hypothetical protein